MLKEEGWILQKGKDLRLIRNRVPFRVIAEENERGNGTMSLPSAKKSNSIILLLGIVGKELPGAGNAGRSSIG